MTIRHRAATVLFGVMVVLAGCTAAPAPTHEPDIPGTPDENAEQFTPLLASVLNPPIPVPTTDGQVHLAYELLLSNVLSQPVTVLSVAAMGDGAPLSWLDDALPRWMSVYGGDPGSTVIGAGQQALVYMDVAVDTLDDVPTNLEHVVEISLEQEIPPIITSRMTETVAPVEVSTQAPIVIGPPVEGANWLDANSCCAVTPHRTAVNPINGRLSVPERFGIDYVQLDSENRYYTGDVTDLASYSFYGADILAVGDGPIVAMVTDLPEQVPGANPTGLRLEEYGGNHVVQDLGNGRYAFYAHLQADNPLGLEIGQVLRRGETLGLLGNTGNTDTPHLHFHIMDSPSPLASNGLPFVIEGFDYVGRVTSQSELDLGSTGAPMKVDTAGAGARELESPLFLDVMSYSSD